jgi:signal transduction histidine kinase
VLAEERGVALELHGGAVFAECDAAQIRQALANLIDNALRHTPRGGRVVVETRWVGDVARLSVADTGPGLDPAEVERVFERFYSRAGEGGGTGLGLPLARAIARAHGGDVSAASPGGALFTLELPAPSSVSR